MNLDGFVKVEELALATNRLIVCAAGSEKSGKTHFALTAPDPIAYFDIDVGLEGVAKKFKHKKIFVAQFRRGVELAQREAEAEWDDLEKRVYRAVECKEVKSLVFDTETEMWELLRMAMLGKLEQVQPYHYGPVNRRMRNLLNTIKDSNKNAVFLSKKSGEYVNDRYTGKLVRAGFKDTPYVVQMNLDLWFDQEDRVFKMRVLDSRHDPDLVDWILEGDEIGFETLLEQI